MRLVSLSSCVLLFCLASAMPAQDAKASVKITNATDDERSVEVNKQVYKVKAKSDGVVTVPAGDFTYKVVGVDDEAVTRTVKAGETWAMTIRAKVTILPGEKSLPPKVTKVEEKVKQEPDWDKSKQARICVVLPNTDTVVAVDDKTMPASEKLKRHFVTPNLGKNNGQTWFYIVTAKWEDGGVKKSQSYKVMFKCGDEVTVDFTKPVPVYRPVYYGPIYYGGCGR